jgi:hypothetical protein
MYNVHPVIEQVLVEDLSTVSIQDVELPNWLYATVTDGVSFGTSDDITSFYPATVAIKGLHKKDVVVEEGRIFYCNDIARTWNIFADIEELDVQNIEATASIEIDSWGFNRDFLLERAISFSTAQGTFPLYYALSNEGVSDSRSLLSYRIRETDSIQLQRQGFASLNTVFSVYLTDIDNNHIVLNDIAKLDQSDLLFAVSDTKLYVYDTYVPALINRTILKEYKSRTTDVHIGLEVYPDSRRRFTIGQEIILRTMNKAPVARFSKPVRVRLSRINESGTRVYLDKSGTTVSADNAWRYSDLFDRGTSEWKEKKWHTSLPSIGEYAFTLETQYLNRVDHPITERSVERKEYDVVPVCVTSKQALGEYNLSAGIQPAKGVTFDFNGNLWIRSENDGNTAHRTRLIYDYCLIDYQTYKLYFREQYNSVVSITSNGLPAHNPPSVI